jgi:hypothetical protein
MGLRPPPTIRVRLDDDAADALVRLAQLERRTVGLEAEVLLRRALRLEPWPPHVLEALEELAPTTARGGGDGA